MALPLPTHPSLLSLNLQGIKSAVKPNWKTNGFVQWEAASINPHLMQQRKAEAETGEFAAVREAIHYFSEEVENSRKKRPGWWTDGWAQWEMRE